MLISFGAFPCEFVRRVFDMKPDKGPKYWRVSTLSDEFKRSFNNFDMNKPNMIPLLRRVVASDKSIETPNCLSRNDIDQYLHHVGTEISEKILQNKDSFKIWMK